MPQDVISWKALEHEHAERGSDWFLALGIISISLSIAAIIFDNTVFAILILAAATTFGILAKKPQKEIEFKLTDRGVSVDTTLYPYTSIKAFWIEDRYEDDGIDDTLIFDIGRAYVPLLVIQIPEKTNSVEIRTFLSQYLTEEELEEPLFQKLVETFTL